MFYDHTIIKSPEPATGGPFAGSDKEKSVTIDRIRRKTKVSTLVAAFTRSKYTKDFNEQLRTNSEKVGNLSFNQNIKQITEIETADFRGRLETAEKNILTILSNSKDGQ